VPRRSRPEDALAYSVIDAADVVGVSTDTIRRAIKAGDLPAKRTSRTPAGRPSGYILIRRVDLEEWLARLPDDGWTPWSG
jgi:excisionase family DNA binding protein